MEPLIDARMKKAQSMRAKNIRLRPLRPEEGVSSKFQAGASPAALSFSATANWAKTESRSQTFSFRNSLPPGKK